MKCADDLMLLFSLRCSPWWMVVLDFLVQPEDKNWKQHETLFSGVTDYVYPLLLCKEV